MRMLLAGHDAGKAGGGMSEWSDNAESAARAKGLVVRRPLANELFVDIDDAESLETSHKTFGLLGPLVTSFQRTPSPSGRSDRWHIRVTLSREVKDDFERIMLQSLLGSDRLHEALSWQAAARGVVGVTLFFEKPEAAE
jgi:hypothetical protein